MRRVPLKQQVRAGVCLHFFNTLLLTTDQRFQQKNVRQGP